MSNFIIIEQGAAVYSLIIAPVFEHAIEKAFSALSIISSSPTAFKKFFYSTCNSKF